MRYVLFFVLGNLFSFSTYSTIDTQVEEKNKKHSFKWYACEIQRELPEQVVIADAGHPLFKAYHSKEKNLIGYGLNSMVNKTAVEFLRFDKVSMTDNILMPLQTYFEGRDKDYYRKYQDKKKVFIRHKGKIWGKDRPNVCEWVLDFFVLASKKSVTSKLHISEAIRWLVDKLESENKLYYSEDDAPEIIITSE